MATHINLPASAPGEYTGFSAMFSRGGLSDMRFTATAVPAPGSITWWPPPDHWGITQAHPSAELGRYEMTRPISESHDGTGIAVSSSCDSEITIAHAKDRDRRRE